MRTSYEVIVIGGGQSGLATGYWLSRAGADFVILERGPRPVGSWPRYYDSLTLFSPAWASALPGMELPGDPERYPTRDEVVEYLERYAEAMELPVETEAEVTTLRRRDEAFEVVLADGRTLEAGAVVVATGAYRLPNRPRLPGERGFGGRVLHSSEYRDPSPFVGDRVAVIGSRNSALAIAHELAGAPGTDVLLASRRPPVLLPQRILGKDIHFWTRWTGLELLPPWLGGTSDRVQVLDDGRYRAALRSGRPRWTDMPDALDAEALLWADGRREPVDAVVFATGFRVGNRLVEELPGAVAADGRLRQRSGVAAEVPGLYFVGLPSQRGFASATLRGAGRDARFVVRHLRRAQGGRAAALACC